ncbi:hypothetical protein A2U01_0084604, partial [Trifolium medium]|nr:hypothetical protein [Trifolium medium]
MEMMEMEQVFNDDDLYETVYRGHLAAVKRVLHADEPKAKHEITAYRRLDRMPKIVRCQHDSMSASYFYIVIERPK